MKLNKKITYMFIPAVLGLGLLGANVASAHGWLGNFNALTPDEIAAKQQTMFQNEAQILGLSVDDVKTAWSQGKTMQQIIQDNKLDTTQIQTRMKDAVIAQHKTKLQSLVGKGIITQAQADARLRFMQSKITSTTGKAGKRMFRGHMGMGLMGTGL